MPSIRYVGPFDEIEVGGHVVKQGEAFEPSDALAGSLLEQSDNFAAVKSTSKKES